MHKPTVALSRRTSSRVSARLGAVLVLVGLLCGPALAQQAQSERPAKADGSGPTSSEPSVNITPTGKTYTPVDKVPITPTHNAPEIDPTVAGGALILLLGGVLLLTDRRRRQPA